MLTILGGQWGGRRLKSIERDGLRPSSARVKASIFSILESIQWKRTGAPSFSGFRCLDIFAGVGGLGLEILSRGAAHCVFVEKEKVQGRVLKENIEVLGCENETKLLALDAFKLDWSTLGSFDLILMDPPYKISPEMPELIQGLIEKSVLKPGGVLLVEHDPKFHFPELSNMTKHSERTLGPAGITVFLRNE